MNIDQTLERTFGLSDKEAATYLALLELGISTVKPIADTAGVKRTSIYNFIDRLVELRLVTKIVIRGRKHYQAVPPGQLIEIANSRVRELEQQLPKLERLHEGSSKHIRVNYYEGPNEMKNIVREEINCKNKAMYIWPGRETLEMIGGADYMTNIDKQRINKGVHIKAIRFRKKDAPFPTSGHGEKYLRTLRFAPSFFDTTIAMGIYDTGKVSFFSSKKEGFGVMIESQELVNLMTEFYEMLWKNCIPAREGEG